MHFEGSAFQLNCKFPNSLINPGISRFSDIEIKILITQFL